MLYHITAPGGVDFNLIKSACHPECSWSLSVYTSSAIAMVIDVQQYAEVWHWVGSNNKLVLDILHGAIPIRGAMPPGFTAVEGLSRKS